MRKAARVGSRAGRRRGRGGVDWPTGRAGAAPAQGIARAGGVATHAEGGARGVASAAARGRAAFDLAITSVLLDAGAGASWRYRDEATGIVASRSEGLALASLRWFAG